MSYVREARNRACAINDRPSPLAAEYGARSGARVHKSFFYGSKHIDRLVPKTDPNPRTDLMASKAAQWAAETAPKGPIDPSMYQTTHLTSY